MYQLIYISTAIAENDPEMFQKIAIDANLANKHRGITGLLLYYNGTIMQIIEGERDEVIKLYQHIEKDPRHKNPMIMNQDKIEKRQFPDWRMGYKPINGEEDLDFLFEIDRSSVSTHLPEDQSGPLAIFAKNFVRASGLDRSQ